MGAQWRLPDRFTVCSQRRILAPLMTRDAGLPILGVLFAAEQHGLSLVDLFARLPKRFSRAALLRHFPAGDRVEDRGPILST